MRRRHVKSAVKARGPTPEVPLILSGWNAVEAGGTWRVRLKLKGIDGGPHKRWSMWFNSMIREEPYPGLN